jgi:hypothetical protein
MKVGDLVADVDHLAIDGELDVGIVVEVISNVEIPPLIAVLWDHGNISKSYQDELRVLCKTDHNMVE